MTRSASALLVSLALSTALLASACTSSGQSGDDDAADPPLPSAAPSYPGQASPTPSAPLPSVPPSTPGSTPGPSVPPSPPVPSTKPSPPAPPPAGAYWHPLPGTGWQWQLDGTVDQSVDVPVYDIDGFENDAAVVAQLHAKGRKVICYVNAGSWEDFRPDANAFPVAVRGAGNGWKGEKWFDIRQVDLLRPLLAKRFDMCRDKGFDAIEPDLLDAYTNETGFPLSAADQLRYNRMVAELAHQRGLGVALKNDLDQVGELVGDFDFAVNEQCAQYNECAKLTPFIQEGKAVLHVEYDVPNSKYCAQAEKLQLSSMEKHLDLDSWRQPC